MNEDEEAGSRIAKAIANGIQIYHEKIVEPELIRINKELAELYKRMKELAQMLIEKGSL
jgi:hypothetical protein